MRELHFQVALIHREGARLFAGGRNCGDAIALGDLLDGPGAAVRVKAILTYRRYLNILDPGLTGELELSGEALGAIEPGAELFGKVQAGLPVLELLGEGEFHVRPG